MTKSKKSGTVGNLLQKEGLSLQNRDSWQVWYWPGLKPSARHATFISQLVWCLGPQDMNLLLDKLFFVEEQLGA